MGHPSKKVNVDLSEIRDEKRIARILLCCTYQEKKLIAKVAHQMGLSMSQLITTSVLDYIYNQSLSDKIKKNVISKFYSEYSQ